MRKIIVALLVTLMFAGCMSSRYSKEEKTVLRALKEQKVKEAIANRDYTIDMNYMTPRYMPAKNLNYGYYIRVSGDSIYSYLPYVGQAYRVPYGGGVALNFEGVMDGYAAQRSPKGGTLIQISVSNDEDTYLYQLFVFDNGSSRLQVYARERDSITFDGTMEIKD